MQLLNRRLLILGATSATLSFHKVNATNDTPTEHLVKILNGHPVDPQKGMVFYPHIIKIKPGDSIKFKPESPGHNSQSTQGMIPEAATPWKGKISEEITVEFQIPGVYGYHCLPHRFAGVVGLVIVSGDNMNANVETAKSVKQIGGARRVWNEIWTEVETKGLLTS